MTWREEKEDVQKKASVVNQQAIPPASPESSYREIAWPVRAIFEADLGTPNNRTKLVDRDENIVVNFGNPTTLKEFADMLNWMHYRLGRFEVNHDVMHKFLYSEQAKKEAAQETPAASSGGTKLAT